LSAALSFTMTSDSVAFGAARPNQVLAS
jgi:hypothetical protein